MADDRHAGVVRDKIAKAVWGRRIMKNNRPSPPDKKQENGCRTRPSSIDMDERLTVRLPGLMKARWQAAADEQDIDLGEHIRRTVEGRRVRAAKVVQADDHRHLSRLALWSVLWLTRAQALVNRSAMDAGCAIDLKVTLDTLLALFSAVANGEIDEEPLSQPADASTPPDSEL